MTEKKFEKLLNKKKSILIGLVIIIIALIGGTFAFQQFGQAAFNPDLVDVIPGGRIHDVSQARPFTMNQDGERVYTDAPSTGGARDKGVFAENFGDIPIGVRVQLKEFLQIHDEPIVNLELESAAPAHHVPSDPNDEDDEEIDEMTHQMVLNDVSTWSVARFIEGANGQLVREPGTTSAYIESRGISWNLGDTQARVFMPTFNRVNRDLRQTQHLPAVDIHPDILATPSMFNHELVHMFSDASGRSVDALAAQFNVENIIDIESIETLGVQTGFIDHNGRHDFWTLTDARQRNLYRIENNVLVRSMETQTPQLTMTPTNGGVMLMSTWLALPVAQREGNFWIFDDLNPEEGWFYWNGFIPGMDADGITSATSLLINATYLPMHASLGYVVHINADFFIQGHFPADISDEAMTIFGSREESFTITTDILGLTNDQLENGIDVPRNTDELLITTLIPRLYRYFGTQRVETLNDADFNATLAEGERAEGTGISIVENQLHISIDEDEELERLTIRIGEDRLNPNNHLEITINIID